jgi:hypothetical protein
MQISLTVPIDISFTLSVSLQKTTLHDLQRDLRRESRHALRRALRSAIEQIERGLLSSPVQCPRCKRAMRSRGRTARRIVTVLGPIEMQRARYGCAPCRTVRRPLDEWLGMLGSEYTAAVREQALYLSADLPYERAADVLRIFGGIGISGRQIQRLLEAESAHIEAAIGVATDEGPGAVRRRFRRAGKHGASAGVARVMQLRQLKSSGLWDEYWARRVRQEGADTTRGAAPPLPAR